VLKVVTVNVNGIRAAARRGGLEWLVEADPDVICLQEVRATHEQLHEALSGSDLGSWSVAHAPAPQLGRAGVAVLSRSTFMAERSRVADAPKVAGAEILMDSGRWLEVDLDTAVGKVTIVSAYVHAGEVGTTRQDEKMEFLDAMSARMAQLRGRGRLALVCGDVNIAHTEQDIKNWRGNRGKAGFLEEEREHLDTWFGSGWVDLGRRFGGDGPGPYTWWSWRGRGFDTDGGWRIDYLIASPALAPLAADVTVAKARAYAERWSDHAPVVGTFSPAS
jgi:exodeoxyribonuclease-3